MELDERTKAKLNSIIQSTAILCAALYLHTHDVQTTHIQRRCSSLASGPRLCGTVQRTTTTDKAVSGRCTDVRENTFINVIHGVFFWQMLLVFTTAEYCWLHCSEEHGI